MSETTQTIKPGIYDGIPSAEYHAGPGVSNTDLGLLLRSPAHYKAKAFKEDTPAMAFGRLLHTAILEPHLIEEEYAVWCGMDRRRKEGKLAYAEFQVSLNGRDEITQEMLDKANEIAASVHATPQARALLQGGKREQSIYWIDEMTGVLCKCRPDYLLPDGTMIDLKSTEDARIEKFQRSAYDYEYHRQGSFYLEGGRQVLGSGDVPFIWIAVEKAQPFAIKPYNMNPAQAEMGQHRWRTALGIYQSCVESDSWPSYPGKIEPLGLPRWAK